MKFNQERIADNLYEKLKRYFQEKSDPIRILIEGEGVHWNCSLESGARKSKIHCFEDFQDGDVKPEYLISFEEASINKAWGRTYDLEKTISSSAEWISGEDVQFLHNKYDFIDWLKRRIEFIEKELIIYEKELENTARELVSGGSDLYDYLVDFKNRSCSISGFGENEPISFEFQWDKCTLFEVKQNDLKLMACAMKNWLIDEINPSQLAHQFSWIEVGDLAIYYEKGEGIKGEFIESWNSIERFYKRLNKKSTAKILNLIKELRVKGLEEELRAGQSLYTLILSRSRRHGLKQGQNFIALKFRIDKDEMIIADKDDNQLLMGKIQYSKELKDLLKELAKEDIN